MKWKVRVSVCRETAKAAFVLASLLVPRSAGAVGKMRRRL